ncbi:MAG: alpha/beta hydrolase [Lachnospiraceae bacterium]|nr:alpha/beta hydrolase [Lachnospiraceae bacterium]MCI9149412.1 alpha/beta hydrolase [Lachnospiraceae bacterium]
MRIETIKLWENRDDVELTMFLHLPDAFLPNPVKKPAMIACPGGAYQNCPRHGNEGDPVAMTFAVDGYQAFVLEYSVVERAPKGKSLFPAQLIDLGKAILTIKEHADEWGVDGDKISICGFSAGAHLCSMYATTWHNGMLAEKLGADTESFRIMAAVLIYGLHDYVLQEEFNEAHPNFITAIDGNTPIFGASHPDKELLKAYSPVCQATDKMPPVFLAAATDDGLVPAMHTIRMAEKLQTIGVPYECHLFQYGEHGFSLGRNIFEPFRQELAHACAQWVPLAKTFLMHLISPETLKAEENPFAGMELPGV